MNKEFDYPRDFKGIWLPKEIWLDDELNATDKIIFAEIDSLDVEESEGCYASNEYLANFCKCSITKVSTSISKLIGLGYIRVAKTDGRKRWLKTSLSKFESQPLKNEKPEIQEVKESNISSNKGDKNNDKNSIKYAFSDKSSKEEDMYASVSEKQEVEQKPKKKSRFIPKNYTEEQLREHIRPTIKENFRKIEFENELGHIPDGEKLIEDITVEFFRQYEENMGIKHNMLPDKSYINVIRMFVCSTGELREYFDLETYELLIKHYFDTDFNRYGKYDGEVTLCLSHFMNDTIRTHLLNREGILWEKAEDEED